MNQRAILLIISFFIFPLLCLNAQKVETTAKVSISDTINRQTLRVNVGHRVVIMMKSKEKIKGKVTGIQTDSIELYTYPVAYSDIHWIKRKKIGKKIGAVGSFASGAGLLLLGFGLSVAEGIDPGTYDKSAIAAPYASGGFLILTGALLLSDRKIKPHIINVQ